MRGVQHAATFQHLVRALSCMKKLRSEDLIEINYALIMHGINGEDAENFGPQELSE